MSADCVLDTNILIRHFTHDDPALSPRATAFLLEIAKGMTTVLLPDPVVFETVFTLERTYKITRDLIADGVLSILDLDHVIVAESETFRDVFEL